MLVCGRLLHPITNVLLSRSARWAPPDHTTDPAPAGTAFGLSHSAEALQLQSMTAVLSNGVAQAANASRLARAKVIINSSPKALMELFW